VPEINGLDLYPETEKACASILRRGSRGREVRKLQKMLNQWIAQQPVSMSLSSQLSMLDETGIFDRPTETTVQRFQEKNGVKVDGVAGSETWRTLLSFNQ
jgi:murein L,D-transpeptidase YcbB/YkuD